MPGKVYVTTTVPYVNARPHVGFALELVQADAVARYHRLLGHDLRLQSGTDENALKNVVAAQQQDLSPAELVDRHSALYRRLCAQLHISLDDFVRTTEPRHVAAVHSFWQRLRPEDIYLRYYRAAYCLDCEDFLLERDLVNGLCPDHGTPPEEVREENYFFRLSAYQHQLDHLISEDRLRIVPEDRKSEVLTFLRGGLRDISVSRTAARAFGWGIPVPGDSSQIVYVWCDALVNYLTGLGFGAAYEGAAYWCQETLKVHVIGKNVWKFHAIYWPAFLLSAGLPLPDHLVVHGFVTEDGRKISKSRGTNIDPFACINEYGADAVRYYLLGVRSPFVDSDFSTDRLRLSYNTALANDLGNLVSRLTTLCTRAGYGQFPTPAAVPEAPPGYHAALGGYQFNRALDAIWEAVGRTNRSIEHAAPWKALREATAESLRPQLEAWLEELHRIAFWLAPFLPTTSTAILRLLTQSPIAPSGALFPRKLG